MAIARSVIEQHGGRIEIRSQIGRGTQVRVLLPVEAP
jgi:signal transduction histidine kinase